MRQPTLARMAPTSQAQEAIRDQPSRPEPCAPASWVPHGEPGPVPGGAVAQASTSSIVSSLTS
ncbi:hypothetical protein GCM10027446_00260 [Angustibacter peucedani]